jgi:hypothetical protein
MDQAFSELGLDGIEIDAHAAPSSKPEDCATLDRPCAFVVHDDPNWKVRSGSDSGGKHYLDNNTLVNVLRHFADHHAGLGRHLFLELKQPEDCHNAELDIGGKCAARMQSIVRQVAAVDAAQGLADRLHFVSFSRYALNAAHDESARTPLNGRVGFQFIAGVSHDDFKTTCAVAALLSRPVDRVTQDDLDWLAAVPWLSGVWFSPRCYADAAEALSAINETRTTNNLPALQVGISTYQDVESNVREWLLREYGHPRPGLPHVHSFIVDIDG